MQDLKCVQSSYTVRKIRIIQKIIYEVIGRVNLCPQT